MILHIDINTITDIITIIGLFLIKVLSGLEMGRKPCILK